MTQRTKPLPTERSIGGESAVLLLNSPLERSQDEHAKPERKEKPAQPHFLSNTTAPSPSVYFRGPVGTDGSVAGWLGGKGVVCKHTPPPTRRIWHVCSGTYTHPLFAEASLTVGGPALTESREAEHAILSDRAAALRCQYVPARVAVNHHARRHVNHVDTVSC